MEDLLCPVEGVEGLLVVPGGSEFASVQRADRRRLLLLLDYLSRSFDFVLLDTASGADDDHITAIQAADYVLLVTQPKLTALEDGRRMKYIVELMGTKVKMPTQILGLVVTRFDMEDSHYSLDEMESEFGLPVIGAIPDDPYIDPMMGPPVVLSRPGSPTADAFGKCAGLVIERTKTSQHTNLLKRLGRYILSKKKSPG
jgi:MinD-like ATPase involved in chromosome partitioning or flagellar assembly